MNILERIIDSASYDFVNGDYKSHYNIGIFNRTPFDALLKTIKNAFSALDKAKRMELEKNNVYMTKYRIYIIGFGDLDRGCFVIKTDDECNPRLGICGMRIHRRGRPSTLDEKELYFIDKENLNDSFYEYLNNKKDEIKMINKSRSIRNKIFSL